MFRGEFSAGTAASGQRRSQPDSLVEFVTAPAVVRVMCDANPDTRGGIRMSYQQGGWPPQPPQQQPYRPQYPYVPPPRKSWPARHKIATAFLSFFGVLILLIVVAVIAGGGGGGTPTSPQPGSSSNGQAVKESPAASHSAGIGDKVRDGKFEFVITKITHRKTAGDPEFGGETAQGEYTVLHVRVTNIGSETQTFDDSAQLVFDARADIDLNNGGSVFLQDINPGNTVRGVIAFDMPAGVRAVKAELHDSGFSGGVTVRLR
jgi:hypothetical protein